MPTLSIEPPHQHAPPVAPFLGPPQRCGGAGLRLNELQRPVIEAFAHSPDEAFVGEARVTRQRGGDCVDRRVHAIRPAAKTGASVDQRPPAGGDERLHLFRLAGQPAPEQIVCARLMMRGDQRGVAGADGVLLALGQRQLAPCADDFGVSVGAPPLSSQRLRPAHGACAGLRPVRPDEGVDLRQRDPRRHGPLTFCANARQVRPVAVAGDEVFVLPPAALASRQKPPFIEVQHRGVARPRGGVAGGGPVLLIRRLHRRGDVQRGGGLGGDRCGRGDCQGEKEEEGRKSHHGLCWRETGSSMSLTGPSRGASHVLAVRPGGG